ncbi:hypothetical protein D9619_002195 [Psilocybe cf. subviscida]|uniref:Bromo domain-containing protein n=1 Tax=Psilocybe cf. subviscida TaxID=2480587 RepID=A0A8H5F3M7_9AGAR|nr:hypothetical protein D9619_002195 [Psilocybe cf. subviscida]
MNNLLRTLTESHIKPAGDLRLLLTTVKEGRRQTYDNNNKLTDPFYDSLEGLLVDLKTITIDNRDAEAFLKPVSKTEVPDYYDGVWRFTLTNCDVDAGAVIQHPMDFQTMLKKVKSKHYKSKREFRDDLDLIWNNCLTYNAAESHPLRPCVHRLKVKAERLLRYITDRKERSDPPIPSDLPAPIAGIARPRINGGHSRTNSSNNNGYLNGRGSSHTRSSSISSMTSGRPNTIILPAKSRRGDVDFGDSPAIIRTPEGMARFLHLEREVGAASSKQQRNGLQQALRELAPPTVEIMPAGGDDDSDGVDVKMEDGSPGEKRKMQLNGAERPRKRARFVSQVPTPLRDETDDLSQLWWGAVQSDALLGNGLPGIPFGLASSSRRSSSSPTKKVKKKSKAKAAQLALPPSNPKALLSLMNNNIKTMRRVRHTHNKFAALNAATAPPEDEDGAMAGDGGPSGGGGGAGFSGGGMSAPAAYGEEDVVEDVIDERPWMLMRGLAPSSAIPPSLASTAAAPPGPSADARAARQMAGGVEIGEQSASDCMHWSTNKILEHAGFQGTSSVALDVLGGVMAEYLSNVGRTIRFLTDKFGKTMSPEEIILHTLFESGSSKIQDLERYISDDVERYGVRLGELEKKLVGAYRETTAGEMLEDEGLFDSEGEDETGALALGDFADLLGEDYLGFRELGLTEEFGMTNLTIPKRMLKGKKGANKPTALKPTEPPPPYPPPPPFVPLTAGKVDDQIGLLKPYYQSRFAVLASANAALLPAVAPGPVLSGPMVGGRLPGPTMPPPLQGPKLGANTLPAMPATASTSTLPAMPVTAPLVLQPAPSASALPSGAPNPSTSASAPPVGFPPPNPDLTLPDDGPSTAQVKMGPIGQILKPGNTAAAAKKKAPPAAAAAATKSGDGGAGTGGGGGPGGGPGPGSTVVVPAAGPGPVIGLGGGGGGTPVAATGSGSVEGDSGGSQSPSKKRKMNTGVGTGNGRKKKPEGGGGGLPAVVIASA